MKIKHNSINYSVNTVDDLTVLIGEDGDTVVVSDMNRGGTFVYDSTRTADNNGGTVFNGWVRQYDGSVNIKWFGTKGDLEDDTVAIQTAVNSLPSSGGSIYFPSGKYKVTSSINAAPYNNIVFYGDGVGSSQIRSTISGAATLLVGDHIGNSTRTFTLHDLDIQYDGATPPSEGTIAIQAKNLVSPSFIQNFSIQKFYDALHLDASSLQGNIIVSDFIIGNSERYGIYLTGGVQGVWISKGKISARIENSSPVASSIGINCKYTNGVYIDTVDCIFNNRGLMVSPNNNETVHWLFAENLICDSNTAAGVDIVPLGNGSAAGLVFNGSWSSSNEIGFKLRGNTDATIDGVLINGATILNNKLEGIILSGGPTTFKNIQILDSQILSNNSTTVNKAGITVAPGVSNFSIKGNTVGGISTHPNNQTFGIDVLSGVSNNYVITNNECQGNVIGSINDKGTGTNKIVKDNLAYISQGEIKVLSGNLTPGVQNAQMFNVQNPYSSKAIVTRMIIKITKAGGTDGSKGDFGVTSASGTLSTNIINGVDLNAIDIYDNIDDQGTGGNSTKLLDENGGANDWITGTIKSDNATSLAGTYYIELMGV